MIEENLESLAIAARKAANAQLEREQGEWLTRVAPGLLVPRQVFTEVEVEGFPNTTFDVSVRFNSETRSYVMEKLSITNMKGISVSEMHSYSIPTLITQAAAASVSVDLTEETGELRKWVKVGDLLSEIDFEAKGAEMKAAGPTRSSLWWVAFVYAYGRAIGRSNYNDQVVSTFGLPKRTATRWIARARSEGLLDG